MVEALAARSQVEAAFETVYNVSCVYLRRIATGI